MRRFKIKPIPLPKKRLNKVMYTKEEEKQLKIDFWGQLNELLELERGLHKNKVNWMNFNTKIRQLYFRMEADVDGARLCIDLQFPDEGIRELYYEQFTEFKNILDETFDNNTSWEPKFEHWNGKLISRISIEKDGVSLYNRNDWPTIHSFLKDSFIKLEHFWAEFGEVFIQLKS